MLAVRPATTSDISAITAALEEMDRFYGETSFAPASQRQHEVQQALFGPTPAAHMILAYDDEQLAGLATYSFLWPAAGTSKSLYLKELYVIRARRRAGVGRTLMRSLADLAQQSDCSRLEWTTDRDNKQAQQFYRSLNAEINETKLFYRVDLLSENRSIERDR